MADSADQQTSRPGTCGGSRSAVVSPYESRVSVPNRSHRSVLGHLQTETWADVDAILRSVEGMIITPSSSSVVRKFDHPLKHDRAFPQEDASGNAQHGKAAAFMVSTAQASSNTGKGADGEGARLAPRSSRNDPVHQSDPYLLGIGTWIGTRADENFDSPTHRLRG
ncbi:hypothetical protein S7711_11432 [Stachybotrys chartarum IBT 7711]|uniref:Uncharacterized protein n=1 Tax=Stachybotrys chartarum (strain CBS 109288 / IBT 7711) TaxID=1280523 RepID=A0A084AJY8_STACB|nr:hypothetical protein S7711_11432 [Stachybotrys chartarum IBT 7711]KFA46655.1 hypothetical protein S40293_11424 [Stachybotrys chartarum IBT 40293]KFA71760.1 hypothetical protein S40288_11597 [Stachybotrys chartarum IBT 40288]